ncbi:DNA polymerase III subunit chi [Diaphorobacter sp.]|uniref:DNA polymerase III subunit chi n=1 Tax=Diaphorobacter sp. TaxID=1934310 RepID=UPI003D144B3A
MTEVAFHFNAPDKLAYVCRFARKATRHDARVVITGAEPDLRRLDRMLWALGPQDFVAHCLHDSDEELLQASHVVLAPDPRISPHRDVLVNLGHGVPEGFAQFARVVEVVSQSDVADRVQARERWRHYVTAGYDISRHDLVLREGA